MLVYNIVGEAMYLPGGTVGGEWKTKLECFIETLHINPKLVDT